MEENEISIFPEQTFTYGTFGQRFGAALIDGIILYIPGYLVQKLFDDQNMYLQLLRHEEITTGGIYSVVIPIIIGWLYFSMLESSSAQATLGKQALGLKVTDLEHNRISFARATGRHFSKYISMITICIGYLMVLWDKKNQALHDKMAGTLVMKNKL